VLPTRAACAGVASRFRRRSRCRARRSGCTLADFHHISSSAPSVSGMPSCRICRQSQTNLFLTSQKSENETLSSRWTTAVRAHVPECTAYPGFISTSGISQPLRGWGSALDIPLLDRLLGCFGAASLVYSNMFVCGGVMARLLA
jgi:hypothetical protein